MAKRARSAEEIAAEETERQTEMLKWADETAEAVIEALVADIALPFIESDSDDGEQSEALDLMGITTRLSIPKQVHDYPRRSNKPRRRFGQRRFGPPKKC